MYTDMEQWSEIRRRVLVEGVSQRQILRETGMHWETLQKILHHSEPPGYRQSQPRLAKKLGPYRPKIELILREDQAFPPQATAHRQTNLGTVAGGGLHEGLTLEAFGRGR